METELKNTFKDLHKLSRQERMAISNELLRSKPEFLKELMPRWWWFDPCEVNVLIVTDSFLHFGLNDFGLSEFITSFNKLEQQRLLNIRYKVTLAHRQDPAFTSSGIDPMLNSSSFITQRITNFDFENSVNLALFDQVWIFSTGNGASSLSDNELNVITNYMNNGGGLFATGDHGSLGSAMCSQIPRVKDMRYWTDFGANEVGMTQPRRNDTNRPSAGQVVSNLFNNQADDIPQNIAVRTFGAGHPHPLLSISTSKRASGIIDIMPDHPHEGECKQEIVFSVVNPVTNVSHQISSQVIATSFVLSGSTASGKLPTEPHCFPSIAVFDGRSANVGRIVVDSTWHHFVNINLNGVGGGVGLTDNDFEVVQQYFMNIATWMTRKKSMLCWRKWIWINLLKNSQLIEASLNEPKQKITDIKTEDLFSIGMLAKEIISSAITPVFAEEFMLDMIENILPSLSKYLNVWDINFKNKHNYIINYEYIVGVLIGAGFVSLRDKISDEIDNNKFNEKTFEQISKYFDDGVSYGLIVASTILTKNIEALNRNILNIKK